MITPFRFTELFAINQESSIIFDGDCITIDNFFLNYDDICEYIYSNNVEIWKNEKGGKNFIDYYDCRHAINNWFNSAIDFDNKVISVIKYYLNINVEPVLQPIEFNYFKHLRRDISPNLQHHPHKDFDINLLVYLDKDANGGTALYQTDQEIENKEHENLFYDVSNLQKKIIKAKPNRCAIFSGKKYHGGHIDDHDVYYKHWRINLVRFYECILPRQKS